ncbi:MAG: AMP-binding protein [Candidatus Accumulibacter sp.]|nr:AMP-binding protein [Candidatus Accumulibacter propinquus]
MNRGWGRSAGGAIVEVSARLLRVVSVMVEETRARDVSNTCMRSHLERELGLDSLARVGCCCAWVASSASRHPSRHSLKQRRRRTCCSSLSGLGMTVFRRRPSSSPQPPSRPTFPSRRAYAGREVLEWHAVRNHPRHVLLYGDGGGEQGAPESITYGGLLEQARRVATGLVTRGLLPRQTVALMLPTGRDYLTSFFGVMLAGGIPVPIYPPAKAGADRGSPAPACAYPGQRPGRVHHHRCHRRKVAALLRAETHRRCAKS